MIHLLVLLAIVPFTAGSECCKGYNDIYNDWVDPQWCDEYCCGSTIIGGLSCCDSILLQAPSGDRSDYCSLWWSNNVWAPIVTSLFLLAMVVGCCFCCYKCCCSSNRTTIIVPSQAGGMGAPSINTTMVAANTHVNHGYN